MVSSKGIKSTLDPALYYWLVDSEVIGFVAVHVDDFIWCGNACFENQVINNLRSTFQVGKKKQVASSILVFNLNSH